jgi:hypothetical protein
MKSTEEIIKHIQNIRKSYMDKLDEIDTDKTTLNTPSEKMTKALNIASCSEVVECLNKLLEEINQ